MFIIGSLGFLSGVALQSLFGLALFGWAGIGLLVAFIFCMAPREYFSRIGVFVLALILGVGWFLLSEVRLDMRDEWIHSGTHFSQRVFVLSDPEARNEKLRMIVQPENSSSELLLWAPLHPRPARGDILLLSGAFKRIENFTEEFDYMAHLRARNVLYEIDTPKIEAIEPAPWYSFSGFLGKVRGAFLGVFRQTLPEPHASLLGGITIGAEEGQEEIEPDFRTAGVSHIVVLSGYNITTVATVVRGMLAGFGLWISIWGALFGVVFFTLIAGLSASALRAALMAILALLARGAGREYDASRALLFAVLLMVFINPRILVHDISFQLSVLATLGILYCPDRVAPFVSWLPEKWGIREAGMTTIAAQVFVVPFVLYTFGTLSLISLPANIVILPFVPILMFLGASVGILGFLPSWIMMLLSFPLYLILAYVIGAAHVFASIPYASVSFGKGSLFVALGLYGILGVLLFRDVWIRMKPGKTE